MMKISALAAISVLTVCGAASADVSISSKPTQNMSCDAGVCTATAPKAVLNVGDLQTMLASGDAMVKTASVATNIVILQPLTWSGTSRLTLDAQKSIVVIAPITVAGSGALTMTKNDGRTDGDLYFLHKGSITFSDLESSLIIDGQTFTLAADINTLAADMAANDAGSFALANDYNAEMDTFQDSPVGYFEGIFEGLGHTVSNLRFRDHFHGAGFFAKVGGGFIRDIYLSKVHLHNYNSRLAGGLVGENDGVIVNASVSGNIVGGGIAGGLVGFNSGTISRSRSFASAVAVTAGGLVGENAGTLEQSFATGNANGSTSGGLVGTSGTILADCYALGHVFGDKGAGGLAGTTQGRLRSSYSTAHVGVLDGLLGGFVGSDNRTDSLRKSYWDLDTSGVTDPSQGAGNVQNAPGITGLTDSQLKSGLPVGFDPKIWGSDPKINHGYPYLLANPPR